MIFARWSGPFSFLLVLYFCLLVDYQCQMQGMWIIWYLLRSPNYESSWIPIPRLTLNWFTKNQLKLGTCGFQGPLNRFLTSNPGSEESESYVNSGTSLKKITMKEDKYSSNALIVEITLIAFALTWFKRPKFDAIHWSQTADEWTQSFDH